METDAFKYQFSIWAGLHHGAEEINTGIIELAGMVEAAEAKMLTSFTHRAAEAFRRDQTPCSPRLSSAVRMGIAICW